MKQNYNAPVIIVDVGANTDRIPSIVRYEFKKQYPTYKEAELFALSGGVVYTYVVYESTTPDTELVTKYKQYTRGLVTDFGESQHEGALPNYFINIEVGGDAFDIIYEIGPGGEGGGGGAIS